MLAESSKSVVLYEGIELVKKVRFLTYFLSHNDVLCETNAD